MKILMISPVPTHPPIVGNRARILTLVDRLMVVVIVIRCILLEWRWKTATRVAMKNHLFWRFTELPQRYSKSFCVVLARRFERKNYA